MTEQTTNSSLEATESIIKDRQSYPEHAVVTPPTEAGQKAVIDAISAIHDRSYSGRHPELGPMINCVFCGFRHRKNQTIRKCEQKFAVELAPPPGLTNLTANQVLGAKTFHKRRQRPRNKPKKKLTKWQRILVEKQKKNETPEASIIS